MEENKLENIDTEVKEAVETTAEAAEAPAVLEEAAPVAEAVVEAPAEAAVAVEAGEQIPDKKSKYRPVSALGFFGILVLASIPIIGWIFILIWALGGCRKVNKKSYARGVLLKVVLDVVVIGVCIFAAKSWWDASKYKQSVDQILEVAQRVDFEKIGNIVSQVDPAALETISKLQDINPEALNGLTQIAEVVEVDENGNIDSVSLIQVIQNMQGVDMESINKYLEDPAIKEIIEKPELMKELEKLEGLKDVVTVEDAKKLLENIGDLSSIIGDDNNSAFMEFIKNMK